MTAQVQDHSKTDNLIQVSSHSTLSHSALPPAMPKNNLNTNSSVDQNGQETFRGNENRQSQMKNNNLTASFK